MAKEGQNKYLVTCASAIWYHKKHNASPSTEGFFFKVCETEVLSFLFQLTSQHPYAEVFIGRPHVWTVDLDNQKEVEDAVKAILSQKVVSFISSPFCSPTFVM